MEKELKFLLYSTPQGEVNVDVIVKDETIWITQKAMGELFEVNPQAISKHLNNIYESGELERKATCSKMEQVQTEGTRQVTRNLDYFNLDAIIAVGYRVNSHRATHFRIWATNVLKEYIRKGFVLDDERLKQGQTAFGQDYFQELLERVRSIRASERRIWQKIRQKSCEKIVNFKIAGLSFCEKAILEGEFGRENCKYCVNKKEIAITTGVPRERVALTISFLLSVKV